MDALHKRDGRAGVPPETSSARDKALGIPFDPKSQEWVGNMPKKYFDDLPGGSRA